jgi:RES domain-containing protein
MRGKKGQTAKPEQPRRGDTASDLNAARLLPNPFYQHALRMVRGFPCLEMPWSGVAFRSVGLDFAKPEQIVDGIGALRSGGRWNRPGLARVLYCSLEPGTAAEESMRLFEVSGLALQTVKPRLIVGVRYRLKSVIELPRLIDMIQGMDLAKLMAEEWQNINAKGRETQGQAIGRVLFNLHVEALLVPSARVPKATNLVVFLPNLRRSSRQEVLEQAELRNWLKQ